MPEQTSFLFGANAEFIAELYARYVKDPASVDSSWAGFFADLSDDQASVLHELKGASWAPRNGQVIAPEGKGNGAAAPAGTTSVSADQVRQAALDSIRALMLIRAYRVRGHLYAQLDPLGIETPTYHPELDPKTYGFGDGDLDRPVFLGNVLGMETATVRQIMDVLRATYAGTIGVEFMHIQDPDQKAWIQERIEGLHNRPRFDKAEKRTILERLSAAEGFEKFLQLKYTGTKRFGLEGGEAMIPALETAINRAGEMGLRDVVVGMAHRGRLNVLTNIMQKPFRAIFSEFQGVPAHPEDVQGSGDVKYHLGTSSDRDFGANTIHLSLTANPSHLEAVNPVVVGKVRAKQQQRCGQPVITDDARSAVMGVLIHGDAAFAGQGIVPETLMLSELRGYRTGGTLHFVINNQIGFTTKPSYSRSGPYPTDVAKMIQAPIFHVNGDDPEAVVHVSRIAAEFRQTFHKDVVVDMFCYRRHGHNEGDEPAFTQPLMYKLIRTHTTTRDMYAQKLVNEGTLTAEEADKVAQNFQSYLETEFEAGNSYKPNKADWLEGKWSGLGAASDGDRRGDTAASLDTLKEVGKALVTVPSDFNLNSKIARQLKAKADMFETGKDIDWATAEALAFGTLLVEGVSVRLSGQDVGRGTFSQRHVILHDQENETRYLPLNHIREGQASFEAHDSPLSELAVLGFEHGYTLAEPHALVLWEAQFGDFVNGAQIIIDQFISSAESKWLRMSGLVMLLPHGYEGQGPEHSSGRVERFLQLCGEDNMQVANCTTPASYYHILRRQMRRNFRKPLIIMTPKSLLRHKLVVSDLAEFGPGTSFHRVLGETGKLVANDKVKRVVLCTGKVYYDLLAERDAREIKDVAIVRLEQLYPFPADALAQELAKYPNADVVWCQEEPENMGYWFFVDRRIEKVLTGLNIKAKRPSYVGRPDAASPATGLLKRHNREQAQLVDEALSVKA